VKRTILSLAAATGLLIGSAAIGVAQQGGAGMRADGPGAPPGHEMQEHGSKPGEPGASGYAPGHERMGDGDRDDRTAGRAGDRDGRVRGGGDRDDRLRGDREPR